MKKIGIVDITTLGTTQCQLAIVNQAKQRSVDGAHPEFVVHSFPFSYYQQAYSNEGWDWDRVVEKMLQSIKVLQRAGADFIIIPNNTAHSVIDQLQSLAPIPVLNMLEVVADACVDLNLQRVSVLGTLSVMKNGLYTSVLEKRNRQAVVPTQTDQQALHQIIFEECLSDQPNLDNINHMALKLSALQCDGFILGCSELPLFFKSQQLLKPCIDCNAVLARAAIAYAKE